MLKKLTLVAFAVLALATFSACDDEGGEGPEFDIGTLDGACREDGTCDSGLACNAETNTCVKVMFIDETVDCPEDCLAGQECKDGACIDIPVPEPKGFGDACASTSECGENLLCTDSKCAWDPDFVIPFADANLKQAVIDAIKITDPAYSATDVKVADCQKLPKVELNPRFGTTPEFITLVASNRGITDVAGIQYCTNLQVLYLDGNGLTTLPADIFTGLTSLQRLYLDGNGLTTLPTGIFTDLTNLQELYLGYNQLTNLSTGIFTGLTSLQLLGLRNNQLSTLPAGIFDGLTNLQTLGLSYNKISDISALSGLTKLTYLSLLNDPIVDLAPIFKLYKDGGLPKGSKLKINNFTNSYANNHTLNILKAAGVNVITSE